MKLLDDLKQRVLADQGPTRRGDEGRLQDAEERAERLNSRAEWLRLAVGRRDLDNHWQASVRELFQGG